MRTVKRKARALNTSKFELLEKLCEAYACEKRYWVDKLRSWSFQAQLESYRKIRDEMVNDRYSSGYGLQARHWKLALQDAMETWDKYWKALFVEVRKKITKRQDFSSDELHYAYWLLKGYVQFADLMQGGTPTPPFKLERIILDRIAKYVRRLVKRFKKKPPSVKKARIVKLDANCYTVFEQGGHQYIKIMSLVPGKRIVIPLMGKTKIEGNITIVLSGNEVSVHISQKLDPEKKCEEGRVEAVDFGYTEVMTDTQGIRYGEQFGKLLTQTSNRLHDKMQSRHKLHAIEKKLTKTDKKKAKNCLKFNLGKQKQQRQTKKAKSTLEREINAAINNLIKLKNPSTLITEDLSHPFVYNKSKSMNRKLSYWLKGRIQDRIAFKALAEGFRHEQVNPAYGSQICPCCEFVDHKNRSGDTFKCLNCEYEDVADRVAALNYAKRFVDKEIGRYTPYRQVKSILLSRFHRRLETGKPVTVPGRTLETVTKVHPPPIDETKELVTAGREKSLRPDGQSESETK